MVWIQQDQRIVTSPECLLGIYFQTGPVVQWILGTTDWIDEERYKENSGKVIHFTCWTETITTEIEAMLNNKPLTVPTFAQIIQVQNHSHQPTCSVADNLNLFHFHSKIQLLRLQATLMVMLWRNKLLIITICYKAFGQGGKEFTNFIALPVTIHKSSRQVM